MAQCFRYPLGTSSGSGPRTSHHGSPVGDPLDLRVKDILPATLQTTKQATAPEQVWGIAGHQANIAFFCRLPDGTSCAAVAASAINPAVSTPGRDMGQGHRAPPHLSAAEMVHVGTSYQKRYVALENARKRYICSQGLKWPGV